MVSSIKVIRDWKNKNGNQAVVFSEKGEVLEVGLNRTWGSANYQGILFRCSVCGKSYDTEGALRYYHKKCLKSELNKEQPTHKEVEEVRKV